MKSTNGTFLNGEVVRRERLRHLDVITLGKAVNLIYVLRGEDYKPVHQQGIIAARLVPLSGEAAPYALPVGETTMGRSEACNVVTDSGAVSKIHARIERSATKLTIEDLGSSNGTVVNGTRTRTAVLRNGDEISLAGVEGFRVEIEMGEVSTPSSVGAESRPPAAKPPQEEGPEFSPDWKTRFEWSSGEMEELKLLQDKLAAQSAARRDRATAGEEKEKRAGSAAPAARKPAPPRAEAKAEPKVEAKAEPKAAPPAAPKAAPPKAAPPAAPKAAPPKPAAAKPEPAKAAAPGAEAPKAPPPAPAPPRPEPPAPAPPSAAPPAPPPPKAPTPTPPKPEPPAPAELDADATVIGSAAPGAIVEIRLVAPSFDLVVSQAGEHRIGRSSEASLRVVHPTVSRKHARLILSDDRLKAWVQHDGGANGTRHNGREIERLEELSEGDQVEVGDVKLRVLIKRL